MTPADFTEVLALNEESVQNLSPLSYGQLEDLHRQSAFSRVVDVEGRVIAFILALVQGADSALYREVFAHASRHMIPVVACEFDVEPPNPASERFHAKFGFVEVGRQSVAGGRKAVSLQTSVAPHGRHT
jgi:predicted GNAT superfamily acetyltransferase